ncbi:hypothetical protein, partial [Rhodovulum sp.]|uniref:hypothetical protein n=1 Tax=Rhodovulum sp. TaxID=34009 RepID=UPI00184169BB
MRRLRVWVIRCPQGLEGAADRRDDIGQRFHPLELPVRPVHRCSGLACGLGGCLDEPAQRQPRAAKAFGKSVLKHLAERVGRGFGNRGAKFFHLAQHVAKDIQPVLIQRHQIVRGRGFHPRDHVVEQRDHRVLIDMVQRQLRQGGQRGMGRPEMLACHAAHEGKRII